MTKFIISYLFTEFEAFKKGEIEYLHEMMTCLTILTNELTFLGKVISTEEWVEKVLRVLPKSKLDVKVTAIREAKDLTKMCLDELFDNLKTYEIQLNKVKKKEVTTEKKPFPKGNTQ